jgi:hypothetical protein
MVISAKEVIEFEENMREFGLLCWGQSILFQRGYANECSYDFFNC